MHFRFNDPWSINTFEVYCFSLVENKSDCTRDVNVRQRGWMRGEGFSEHGMYGFS